jgi:flagellar hook assembly protein FlgD
MLYDAYPNPFNPVTNIKYHISKSAAIKITIFDIKGQLIEVLQNKEQTAGTYEITWDAGSKASGIYFVRMESQTGFNQTKKIMLIK